jgi:TrmH family RNA methyltransferase
MKTENITSLQNARVKEAVRLRDRGPRDKSDLFLIEGYRELLRAVDASRKIDTLFICPDLFLGENEEELIKRTRATVYICSKEVFHKISYRDRPDGLLAIAPQHHAKLEDLKFDDVPLLIVAEAIEKPGNLGTILRSSDASGCNGVIVCDRCTDIHNPNVVRASVGTLFTLPVIEASSEKTLKWLRDQGICILAATPSADKDFTEVDMTVPLAIAVGTEQLGLSDLWMKQADLQVRIPMYGVADSLNVATATTLLLYEAQRQRKMRKDERT